MKPKSSSPIRPINCAKLPLTSSKQFLIFQEGFSVFDDDLASLHRDLALLIGYEDITLPCK
ncbi:MAG: hypothetical protein H0U70_03340 [Tatlockia sp.]|nr:hypothetical protein [Tatlockia sp.]